MEINSELTKKIAAMAQLSLTEAEIEIFTADLQEILKAFSILDSINVENTASSFRPIETKNHLRPDLACNSLSQEEVLIFTKNKRDGFFIGPKTVG